MKTISVKGRDKKSGSLHRWNKVKIDNNWYNIDVTYTIDEENYNKCISNKYFLISDKVLSKTHKENENRKYIAKSSYSLDVLNNLRKYISPNKNIMAEKEIEKMLKKGPVERFWKKTTHINLDKLEEYVESLEKYRKENVKSKNIPKSKKVVVHLSDDDLLHIENKKVIERLRKYRKYIMYVYVTLDDIQSYKKGMFDEIVKGKRTV